MTDRLYYLEPYRTEFDAAVVGAAIIDGRTQVTLDQTAFYPTSGGQPFDTGTLTPLAEGRDAAPARVLDVIDREDGTIAHVLDRELEAGTQVRGVIDWARRFAHMQQHTGQHVLSAAFDRLLNARTESFHLGTTSATIDLSREVSRDEVAAVEDEANRIVWEDRPVHIRFASAEEAAALPLRKEPVRTGPLRLIEVEAFDLSACGGTHVARTGAIGIIAISGWEKFRKGSRIEFLCGVRALARFRQWRDALAATQQHLSVTPDELPGAVERVQGEVKALQRTLRGFQEQLAAHEARALLARATRAGDRVIVAEALEGWDAQGLKAIAAAATAADPSTVIALFTNSQPALVVVARGAGAGVDASAMLKALTAEFGGKGGGKPDLAQGGGLNGAPGELIGAFLQLAG